MNGIRINIALLASLVIVIFASSSCRRRPLTTADNNVMVNISIDDNIVNYQMKVFPELMRTAFFYDSGTFSTHAFLPHNGGFVNVIPGKNYDMLVYNFGTRSTIMQSEYKYDDIFATTNEVSENYKSKLKSRSSSNKKEMIVFEPDHLFVGKIENAFVPVRGVDMPPVVFDVHAKTVVESWKIKIDKIEGVEWISGIAGVVTGLSQGNWISRREKSESDVSVFFESMKIDENGVFEAAFNTFGYIPHRSQVLSLVITDLSGQGHEYNIDISPQFVDNKEQIIHIITDKIVIDKPDIKPGTGGGLAPQVDEWQNIETDIII